MPKGSRRMCGTGLRVTWPPRAAVSSPPIFATSACAASWHVVESKKTTYQSGARARASAVDKPQVYQEPGAVSLAQEILFSFSL